MCLAVPGKVLAIETGAEPVMGTVSFGGLEKRVCLDWVPGVVPGDYVIVHVGFALSKVDEEEALETLRLLEKLGEAGEDRSPDRQG